jgi:1-deoxy-D-xylulose-5-phosphate reductoisomerase
LQMAEVVEEVLTRLCDDARHTNAEMTLDSVLHMDHLARQATEDIIAAI